MHVVLLLLNGDDDIRLRSVRSPIGAHPHYNMFSLIIIHLSLISISIMYVMHLPPLTAVFTHHDDDYHYHTSSFSSSLSSSLSLFIIGGVIYDHHHYHDEEDDNKEVVRGRYVVNII